jgi:hypothetical protein
MEDDVKLLLDGVLF